MSQASLLGRMGLFKKRDAVHAEVVNGSGMIARTNGHSNGHGSASVTLSTLGDLLQGIRDGLDNSSRRQDEMLDLLRQLPQSLQELPETNKLNAQALMSLADQVRQQQQSQGAITTALQEMARSHTEGRQTLQSLGQRLDSMREADVQMVETLRGVGLSMAQLSAASTANLETAHTLRETIRLRDQQFEKVTASRGAWIAGLVAFSAIMSVLAFAAGVVVLVVAK